MSPYITKEEERTYDKYKANQIDIIRYRKKRRALRKKRRQMKVLIFFIVTALVWLTVQAVLNNKDVGNKSSNTAQNGSNGGKAVINTNEKGSPKNPFSNIYYYEADKLERYESYKKLHPELKNEDVIWQVNSGLDSNWYENTSTVSSYDDPYIVVNKYNKVPDGYRPPDLESYDGHLLRKEAGDAYVKMRNAASRDGYSMVVVSGYRTVDYQRNLYNSYLQTDSLEEVDRYSARAGFSEHHTGMALDLFGSSPGLNEFENTPEYKWLLENGYKYGFIIRYWTDIEKYTGYKNEPWHIRYVGVDVSTDMHNKNIKCFEEYHAKFIKHKE